MRGSRLPKLKYIRTLFPVPLPSYIVAYILKLSTVTNSVYFAHYSNIFHENCKEAP